MARQSYSGGNVMWLLGGAVLGAVASRFLAPAVAQGMGTACAAMGHDPFEPLIRGHRIFESLLTRMEDTPDEPPGRRIQLFLRLKRRLAAHALAEEDIVYPLLHDEADAKQEARGLYDEHADIKMHLHALEQMPDGPKWTTRVRTLRELVEKHARDEEEVEFPRLRQLLSERDKSRLAGNIRREKSLISDRPAL